MNKSYNNLNIKNLIRTDFLNQFDEYQMKEIKTGLFTNINVLIYAKPEFSYEKMRKIRNELEENHSYSYLGL